MPPTKKKLDEILIDPTVDVHGSEPKKTRQVNPSLVNAVQRLLDLDERKEQVKGMRKLDDWLPAFKRFLREELTLAQGKLATPEHRKDGETAEFLAGQMKGLIIVLGKIQTDEKTLLEIEEAELYGLGK